MPYLHLQKYIVAAIGRGSFLLLVQKRQRVKRGPWRVFPFALWRHRVKPRSAKRITAQNAPNSQRTAFEKPMNLQRLYRVY